MWEKRPRLDLEVLEKMLLLPTLKTYLSGIFPFSRALLILRPSSIQSTHHNTLPSALALKIHSWLFSRAWFLLTNLYMPLRASCGKSILPILSASKWNTHRSYRNTCRMSSTTSLTPRTWIYAITYLHVASIITSNLHMNILSHPLLLLTNSNTWWFSKINIILMKICYPH